MPSAARRGSASTAQTYASSPEVPAIIMIAVAAVVTGVMLAVRRDAGYALVVAWALAGIALKRSADDSAASRTVFIAAIACGAVVAAGIVASAIRSAVRPLES